MLTSHRSFYCEGLDLFSKRKPFDSYCDQNFLFRSVINCNMWNPFLKIHLTTLSQSRFLQLSLMTWHQLMIFKWSSVEYLSRLSIIFCSIFLMPSTKGIDNFGQFQSVWPCVNCWQHFGDLLTTFLRSFNTDSKLNCYYQSIFTLQMIKSLLWILNKRMSAK